MKERFEGTSGRRLLVEALLTQRMVGGIQALADEMAEIVELIEVEPGTALIKQGGEDNDVYFVIAGSFAIVVNGQQVAQRFPNDSLGEMAALQSNQKRAASVIATEKSIVCKLTEARLANLGERYSAIYRWLAKDLARRLEQRNAHVNHARDKIKVFVISSAEAIPIARSLESALDHDNFAVDLWTDGVFQVSNYPIESLEKKLDDSDFAIAIAQPDDITETRDKKSATPRDNVIFEIGLFIGRLGRKRAFVLEPRGEEGKLPSDLTGLTTLTYKIDADGKPRLGPSCERIRELIKQEGPKKSV